MDEKAAASSLGTPKSTLRKMIGQLEEERTELNPTTPVPKLREKIHALEEELKHELLKNQSDQMKNKKALQQIEAELKTKTDALQLTTKEFEKLLKDRANVMVETPGTPAAVLHQRIKQLQQQSSQLPGTPPAQLRKQIHVLETECKLVQETLVDLQELNTREKQLYEQKTIKSLDLELNSLKVSLEEYEEYGADLRARNSEMVARNTKLVNTVIDLRNLVHSLTTDLNREIRLVKL